jgi:ABC-type nitrate/sulfonate/bicarbonate transport system substrate-binding protein
MGFPGFSRLFPFLSFVRKRRTKNSLALARNSLLIILTFVSAGVAGAVAAIGTPNSHQTVNVVIGIPSTSFEFLPVIFANYSGYWKNYGVNVTLNVLQGESQMASAVSSGTVKIGVDTPFTVALLVSQSFAVRIVAQVSNQSDYVLVVTANQRYSTIDSLNNTSIGLIWGLGIVPQLVNNLGSNYSITLRQVRANDFSELVGDLMRNNTQSFITTYDNFYSLESTRPGTFKSVLNFSELYPHWKSETVVFARRDFINSSPVAVSDVLKGIFYAVNYLRSHPKEALSFASAHLGMSTAAANLTITRLLSEYQLNGVISVDGLSYALQFDEQAGIIPPQLITSSTLTVSQLYTNQFTPVRP